MKQSKPGVQKKKHKRTFELWMKMRKLNLK